MLPPWHSEGVCAKRSSVSFVFWLAKDITERNVNNAAPMRPKRRKGRIGGKLWDAYTNNLYNFYKERGELNLFYMMLRGLIEGP